MTPLLDLKEQSWEILFIQLILPFVFMQTSHRPFSQQHIYHLQERERPFSFFIYLSRLEGQTHNRGCEAYKPPSASSGRGRGFMGENVARAGRVGAHGESISVVER